MVKQEAKPSFRLSLTISLLVAITIILTIVVFSWMQEADATTIGITLSRSCQLSSNCPTYEDLIQYDNSNQYYSGFLKYSENGIFERQQSPYKNHWEFYKYTNNLWIFVDPHGEQLNHLDKIIPIEPSSFSFFVVGDFKIEPEYEEIERQRQKQICADWKNPECFETVTWTDRILLEPTRTVRHDQWINSHCNRATTTPDALVDTINHFIQKCEDEQEKQYVETIVLPQLPFHYKDSQWFYHAEYMKKAIESCKVKC